MNSEWPDYSSYSPDTTNHSTSFGVESVFGTFPCIPAYVSGMQSYCDNDIINPSNDYKSQEKERNNNMSFTGIVIINDAMIAFGDSRSTRIDAFNNMMRDASTQVKKVFMYDENTLLAVSGVNVVMEKSSLTRLETIIGKCIEEEHTDIFRAMEKISLAMKEVNGSCYIYIGRKEADGKPTIQEVTINGEGVFMKPRNVRNELHITLLMNEVHVFSQHLGDALTYYETKHEEYKKEDIMQLIEDCIRADIERVEKEYDYCPVGLPVQFEVMEL